MEKNIVIETITVPLSSHGKILIPKVMALLGGGNGGWVGGY